MNRDRYKTVTDKESFALLIQASPEEAMGEATFLSESMPGVASPLPVRPVTREDLRDAGAKLKGIEGKRFNALLAVRGALEARDDLAMANARERMEQVYQLQERELIKNRKLPENEEMRQFWPEFLDSFRPGPKAKQNLHRLFSFEVSQAVGLVNSQIVLWWADKIARFVPAIFCLDVQTALYLHTFFIAPTGGPGCRICPYDGEQFFQDRPNQDYCCPAHREAHRVARFRNRKMLETEKAKTNRRKSNGTQKAR